MVKILLSMAIVFQIKNLTNLGSAVQPDAVERKPYQTHYLKDYNIQTISLHRLKLVFLDGFLPHCCAKKNLRYGCPRMSRAGCNFRITLCLVCPA